MLFRSAMARCILAGKHARRSAGGCAYAILCFHSLHALARAAFSPNSSKNASILTCVMPDGQHFGREKGDLV